MQTVSTAFHDAAQGEIVPLDWKASISFDKEFTPTTQFFTFDSSEFDGSDLLAPSDDNPVSYWDYYKYVDYTARIMSMEWSREIDFPYSVSAAVADFVMNNFDDYFTPGSGSPVDEYILPGRPVRLYAGYKNAETIQQFVGLTEKVPIRDENAKTISFHALDFLSVIYTLELNETVAMQDVTVDIVLAAIFTQFGIAPSSYSFSKGRNIIPFLFFEKGSNAGNAIREMMQAEGGALWIDEQGVIRMEPRLVSIQEPVMTFDNSNTIDGSSLGEDQIINYVKINSEVRAVQSYQVVSSDAREPGSEWRPTGDPFVIPANSTRDYPVDLDDPCLTIEEPVFGESSDVSWLTAVDAGGSPIASGVSVLGSVLNTNQFITTIQNTNSFPIEIDQIELWGQPARIINTINFRAKDQDSINKYEEHVLDITNNYFGNFSNCDSFARTILDAYANNDPVIELSVKGDYSLQLGDIIDVNFRSFIGRYKVLRIAQVLNPYSCVIQARRYIPRKWFTFDVDEFDGDAVLAP